VKNRTFAVLAALATTPWAAYGQAPVVKTESVEVLTTIEAIDHTARLVTLKNKDGSMDTIYAPSEVKRFSELKVGDKVSFKYYESRLYQIRKPGQPAPPPVQEAAVTRGTGAKPGATIAEQKSATVTVKAVDANVPSVTVVTGDGRTASFKVDDKKSLDGVKAGDKVDITYTQAVLISVK
jgi:Cu/Ag efflux protein CusF